MELRVSGAHELDALARRLREAGEHGLLKAMDKGLRKGAEPIPTAIREAIPLYLPSGFVATMTRSLKHRLSVRTQGRQVGVRILLEALGEAGHPRRIQAMDNPGNLRHMVFKRKGVSRARTPWVDQRIRPGFASDQAEARAPHVRRVLADQIHELAEKITKG